MQLSFVDPPSIGLVHERAWSYLIISKRTGTKYDVECKCGWSYRHGGRYEALITFDHHFRQEHEWWFE